MEEDAWQGFSRETGLSDPSTATRRRVGRQQQQLPIPWIRDSNDNNMSVTMCRLKSLKSSLARKEQVETYDDAVKFIVNKGFTEKDEIACQNRYIYSKQHRNNGFYQMAPPARTLTVAFDMSKSFDTINIHTETCYRPIYQHNH